jgi:hypothetical protein
MAGGSGRIGGKAGRRILLPVSADYAYIARESLTISAARDPETHLQASV